MIAWVLLTALPSFLSHTLWLTGALLAKRPSNPQASQRRLLVVIRPGKGTEETLKTLAGMDTALSGTLNPELTRHHDLVFVIDSGVKCPPGMIEEIHRLFDWGADAIQLCLNGRWIKPTGSEYWGFSAGLEETGFGFTVDTLEAVPYRREGMNARLITAGRLVRFSKKVDLTVPHRRYARDWSFVRRLFEPLFEGHWQILAPFLDLISLPLWLLAMIGFLFLGLGDFFLSTLFLLLPALYAIIHPLKK